MRKIINYKMFLCLIITMMVALNPLAQLQTEEKKQISNDEEKEAIELAKLFYEHMIKTGDVAPLIKELFVSDFADKLIPMVPVTDDNYCSGEMNNHINVM